MKIVIDPLSRYTVTEDGCWEYRIAMTVQGYGRVPSGVRKNGKMGSEYAHRAAYIEAKGAIPKDMEIDHLCRNRCCINPDHLEVVTPKVNTLRGVGAAALNARKTHCKRGHEFDAFEAGARTCRSCRREYQRRWREGRRASLTTC